MAGDSKDWLIESRTNYYDRNPVPRTISGSQTVTNVVVAEVVKDSYTVPAGKRAYLETAYCRVHNNPAVVTAANNDLWIGIFYTPSGGSPVLILATGMVNGEDKIERTLTLSGMKAMMPGDKIEIRCASNNTAAILAVLQAAATLTEFDA